MEIFKIQIRYFCLLTDPAIEAMNDQDTSVLPPKRCHRSQIFLSQPSLVRTTADTCDARKVAYCLPISAVDVLLTMSRYEAPREEDKQKQFSYVGFGGGRHGCMGTNFAYLQVWQLCLSSRLRPFASSKLECASTVCQK